MSFSLVDPKTAGPKTPFSFLRRLQPGHGEAPAIAAVEPTPPVAPDAPASVLAAPADGVAQAVLERAARCRARYNFVTASPTDGVEGGLFADNRELFAWALDHREPARPLAVAIVIDGSVVLQAHTDPASETLAVPSGYRLSGHRTLELVIDGQRTNGPAFAGEPVWPAENLRHELGEHLARVRKTWRARALVRALQQNIDGTLARLGRDEAVPEAGATGAMAPLIRHMARRAKVRVKAGDMLGIANWIVSEVFEDPLRREVFCLDAATEAILNAPAFNVQALRADVTLALLCFWRRHYQNLDLFSDEGLRRIQYKFATAPFISLKNNHRLVSQAIRERLSAQAAPVRGDEPPYSWYWFYMYQDQGALDLLKDPQHLAALSFKEVIADALDPGRLSFNPSYWASWWRTWAMGEDVRLSRFDLALIALLANTSEPEAVVAESGPAVWRPRLMEAFYRAMPGLAALSAACDAPPAAPVAEQLPRRDLAIIGHANGTGLARNMAMFAEALAPCKPLLFDAASAHCLNAEAEGDTAVRARVVLLCLNADATPEVIARFAPLCEEAHVIGFFLWETDCPPELHRFGAGVVDEIWTPSSFVADAYRKITDVPVSVVGKGLRAPDPRRYEPFIARFRHPAAFTFLYVAEFASSIIRKNPLDGIRAFQQAFDRDNSNVRLVLKVRTVDPGHWSNIDGYWDEVEEEIAADPRIELLAGDLSSEEYWALIAASDALLSLHRGEGFSYPVADAMLLGRPVVVCDYSGVRDFCDEATAFLVDVDVVPTPPGHLHCNAPIGNWCVPRLASAVAAMRRAVSRRAEAAAKAEAGRRAVLARYDFETWREGLLARLAAALPRHRAALAASPVAARAEPGERALPVPVPRPAMPADVPPATAPRRITFSSLPAETQRAAPHVH
jgi:glycosyltransferase involved in cell wall biosynthesis